MKWWPWRRRDNGNAARAARAEAEARRVQRLTPQYEALADAITVPDDVFADRVTKAFMRRDQ